MKINHERYSALIQMGWEEYQKGDATKMASLLKQSLEYTPYLRVETISDWVSRFSRFALEGKQEFDADYLSDLDEWDNIVSKTRSGNKTEIFYLFADNDSGEITDKAKWLTVSVEPNANYVLRGNSTSDQLDASKQAVIQFQFLDKMQEIIPAPYEGISNSDRFGPFMYLPIGVKNISPFQSEFTTPAQTFYVRIGFRTFFNKKPIILKSKLELNYKKNEQFEIELEERIYKQRLNNFLNLASQQTSKPFVFIWTGTTYIGKAQRSNRSMKFAQLIAEQDIPVIYSYYRWHKNKDFADYEGGYLFQSPIDLTTKYIYHIRHAQLSNPSKLMLVSLPDHIAAQQLNSFKLAGWSTLYEARDEWEEFHKVGSAKWFEKVFESYIANHVDAITVVSPPLKTKMDGYTKSQVPSYIVPNGVSDYFITEEVKNKVQHNLKSKPPANPDNLTIGYFGHLTEAWFDWNLIEETASKNPNWKFEIIGFGEPKNLNLPTNIKLLGTKSHQEISDIAINWDVATITFIPSRLAEAVDPIKVYEYLALALPVVSVYMPQIVDYPYTYCYKRRDSFKDILLKAVQEKVDFQKVSDFLEINTWRDRVKETLSIARVINQ